MHPYFHHLFDCLQGRGEAAAAPRCSLSAVAGGLAVVYGLGARLRRGIYVNELLLPKHLPARVVSVGNLTVGGTGKTPVTACLTRLFQAAGHKVAILSRGYGGQNPGVTCISDGQTDLPKTAPGGRGGLLAGPKSARRRSLHRGLALRGGQAGLGAA